MRALPDAGRPDAAGVGHRPRHRARGRRRSSCARDADEVHTGELPPLPAGDYRLRVEGVDVSAPLADPVHSLRVRRRRRRRPTTSRGLTRDDLRAARRHRRLPAAGQRRCTAAATTSPRSRRTCGPAPASDLDLRVLLDAEATRDTVDRRVPRAPRPRPAPATSPCSPTAATAARSRRRPAIADLEPTGRIQTILLHDCGRRVDGKLRRALADKELGAADRRGRAPTGAHVVDDPRLLPLRRRHPRPVRPAAGVDAAPDDVDAGRPRRRRRARRRAAVRREFLARRARRTGRRRRPPHVALGGVPLRRDGQGAPRRRRRPRVRSRSPSSTRSTCSAPRTTYRSLLATVRVARRAHGRGPAPGAVPARRRRARRRAVPRRRRRAGRRRRSRSPAGRDGWEVDAGIVHGLRDPVGDEAFVLACTRRRRHGGRAWCASPTSRSAGRSSSRSTGRRPTWPTAPSSSTCRCRRPRCSSTRRVDGGPPAADVAAVHDAVRAADRHGRARAARRRRRVRVVDDDDGVARRAAAAGRRCPAPGTARIAPGRRQPGRRRRRRRRRRRAPASSSAGSSTSPGGSTSGRSATTRRRSPTLVTLDALRLPTPGETPPARRPRSRCRPTAAACCTYARQPDGSVAGAARVHGAAAATPTDDLYVAVLDLTDRFRCHAVRADASSSGPGARWRSNDGDPLPATLPAGRAGRAGARRCATGSR